MTSNTLNIYLDFEFNPTFPHFFPISLGMVTEDGEKLYLEYEFNPDVLDPWVVENVVPHLSEMVPKFTKDTAGIMIMSWLDFQFQKSGKEKIEFWGCNPSHDWVLMCQNWTFDTHPENLPRHMNCLRQLARSWDITDYPEPENLTAHHAIDDAIWARQYHKFLIEHQGMEKAYNPGTYPIPKEPLTLKIHNDGKERRQSFEVSADIDFIVQTGYGGTREEAVAEYTLQLRTLIGTVIHLERCVENGTVKTLKVDWAGTEL